MAGIVIFSDKDENYKKIEVTKRVKGWKSYKKHLVIYIDQVKTWIDQDL